MDEILANLRSPSWWFDGVFFSLFLYLIAKVTKFVPVLVKTNFRRIYAKRLRKIKKIRSNYLSVNYEIGKTNSYFILFVLVCCLFLFWFVSGPLNQVAESSALAAFILSTPIYIIEIFWLLQDSFTKDLIERSYRLRTTNRLT